jgi:Rad3-related DNA helicase
MPLSLNEMNLDSVFTNISPADFGLPSRFTGYRREQRDAFSWLIEDCEHQLSAACLPTGIGKTLLGFSLARYYNSKAVYLVATKSLQEQVMDDFGELAADIRGRANYTCLNYSNCDRGYEEECTTSVTTSCPYNRAVELAKDCSIDVTNYAYWLHARAHNRQALERDTQPVELLICDEAHRIEDQITSFAAIHLSQSDLGVSSGSVPAPSGIMTPKGTHWVEADDWRMWAQGRIDKIRTKQDRLETADPNYKRDKVWKELEQTRVKWAKILTMNENWCWQFDDYNGSVSFEPIRVASYARQLFSGVNRVLLMSASLTPFQCSLILDRDAPFDYRAWSPVFPQQNAPFYHVPCKKVNRHSTDDDYK